MSRFANIKETAEHFAVSVSTIRGWVRQRIIPDNAYFKVGNTYRFRLAEIEQALLENPSYNKEPSPQMELDLDVPENDEGIEASTLEDDM